MRDFPELLDVKEGKCTPSCRTSPSHPPIGSSAECKAQRWESAMEARNFLLADNLSLMSDDRTYLAFYGCT
jgi:hypothetical protein